MGNAKCEPRNKNITLVDQRPFECRPIKHMVEERIEGSESVTERYVTVGCKVVIFN